MRTHTLRLGTVLVISLALLLTLALALDLSPLLRGGAGWRWPYEAPTQPGKLIPGAVALLVYLLVGEWWLTRSERVSTAAFLLFSVIGGLVTQLAFLSFYGNPIEQLFLRTISSLSGGFFEVGVNITDLPRVLRDYPRLMPGWTAHPKAHPPGIVLLFWGTAQLFNLLPGLADSIAGVFRVWQCHHRVLMALPDNAISAALLGMALPLFSLLTIIPAYDLARRLYDRLTALRTALWLPLIPALIMFTPQWNQLYILFTVAGLWLLHRALSEAKPLYMALIGLLMSGATFLSFTNVNLIGLFAVYVITYWALIGRLDWTPADWRRILIGLALFTLGLAIIWLIYYAISGNTAFDLLSTALNIHYGLNEPYLPWLFFFPLDLSLFGGLILSGLTIVEIIRVSREALTDRQSSHPQAVLPLSVLIAVLGLDISGLVRGEVGRLLLWIMPLIVITAARAVSRSAQPRLEAHLSSLALAFQLVVMVAFLRVIGTELAPPPDPPFVSHPPHMTFSAQARFDNRADLLAYEAELSQAGDTLILTLYWQPVARFDHAYFVSAIVIGPDGQALGVLDWLPVDGGYPTSCWRPGEIISDHVSIPLNAAPPGDYWLSVSLFDYASGERLPVQVPGLEPDTQVGLGPIPIP